MKVLKPLYLTDKLVRGHDVYLEVDPFVVQGLLDVLKCLKFQVDPGLSRITSYFEKFENFGYRIHSGKLPSIHPGSHMVHANVAYHEGFHSLIGLKFGTELAGRPLLTLLNECLGQGFAIYFPAKILGMSDIKYSFFEELTEMKKEGARLGVSFDKLLNEAVSNPFAVYKQASFDSFEVHKRLVNFLAKNKRYPARALAEFSKDLRSRRYTLFFSYGDMAVSALFLAANCGFKSTKEDLRSVNQCLEILSQSNSMEDYFKKLGILEYLGESSRKILQAA